MHFTLLLPVDIDNVTEDEAENKKIQLELERIKSIPDKSKCNFLKDYYVSELIENSSTFSRELSSKVETLLEPYYEQTDNIEYLEFEDMTEEIQEVYYTEFVDCFKLSNGSIVPQDHYSIRKNFCVHDDGLVYQSNFGQLRNNKRSKKAKSMIVLPNYPVKRLYKSFDEYACKEWGCVYNEEAQAYGYYYNPNTIYDWYQIGGRWADMFLVKDTCSEYSFGHRYKTEFEAPEGYIWVAAARKKDIEWDAMRDWKIKCYTEAYNESREIFKSGNMPDGSYMRIVGNKVMIFDEILYIEGESLETNLKRKKVYTKFKYHNMFYSYLDDGEYYDKYNKLLYTRNPKQYKRAKRKNELLWNRQLQEFVDSLSDDTVLVCVDYHI